MPKGQVLKKILNSLGWAGLAAFVIAVIFGLYVIFEMLSVIMAPTKTVGQQPMVGVYMSDQTLVIEQTPCATPNKDSIGETLTGDLAFIFSLNTSLGYNAKTQSFTVYDQGIAQANIQLLQNDSGEAAVTVNDDKVLMSTCIVIAGENSQANGDYVSVLVLRYNQLINSWEYLELQPNEIEQRDNTLDA